MHEAAVAMAVAGVLLIVGVMAGKVGSRLGIPALLVFLGVGMLAGSDGVGQIEFSDYEAAQAAGAVALTFILFAGGLETDRRALRPLLAPGITLATVGVTITAGVTGSIAAWALNLPLETGLLLGAIVASTDVAAVFSVLGTREARLRSRLRQLLELESGSNDPMAVVLTIELMRLITEPDVSAGGIVLRFAIQLVDGLVIGWLAGRVAVWGINRVQLRQEGLYPVLTIAVAAATFGLATVTRGSGFLAVYVAGATMASHDFLHQRTLLRFHDGVAWLSQVAMFLLLGVLVFPSDLPGVAGPSLIVAAALVLLARPLAVACSLAPFRTPWRDVLFVSWVGLRGAVPIVLATFPLVEGIEHADRIFDVVFFVVLVSVLVQGTTISWVANRLDVVDPGPAAAGPAPLEAVSSIEGDTNLHQLRIAEGAPAVGKRLVEADLPEGVLVVLLTRGGRHVVPIGTTELRAGDEAMVLADSAGWDAARVLLGGTGDAEGARAPR